tara:strand:- start:102 stop:1394 length:1293 start_codon:yes stop_codon:yes gene_type:complete
MQVAINMRVACALWSDYKRDNLLNMCRGMILHQLLKNGITFERNKKDFEPSVDIQDAFDEYWHSFVQDALDSAICLGFVVVQILKDKAGRKYPTVVYPHLYQIRVRVENNHYEYYVESAHIDVKDTLIYTHFGCTPLPNGELTSIVSRVMDKCIFLRHMRHTTLLMEKNKTNPDYFAEVHESSNRERHEGVDFDFYADDMGEDANTEMQFERNKRNVDILIKQQELYQQYLGRGSKQAKNLHNITQLPNGQRVVPTAQNTGRQDVSQLHKIIQEEICSGMGVPRSLMIGDSLYKSDTEGVTDMFKYNILWWKRTLGSMCTDIYQKIYVDTKKLKVSKNVFASKIKHQIRVQFPVHPYIPMEQLDYLYSNGIIDWDVYSKHCLRNTSLPDHLRMKHPPSTQPSKEPSKEPSKKVDAADVVVSDAKRKRSAR